MLGICVCDDKQDVKSAVLNATAVIQGQVEDTIWLNPFDYLVKIRVYRSWKGSDEPYLWIASTKFEKECGFNFITGHVYLIYAHSVTANLLAVSMCSRTKAWEEVTNQEHELLYS